jgi:DNA-binding protein H-NS
MPRISVQEIVMADDAGNKKSVTTMLDAMSVAELTALIEAATVKRHAKQDEAKATMLAKWKAEAAEAGLAFEALIPGLAEPKEPRKPRKDQGSTLTAKFRGPNGEEWSGRGRMPKWLTALEASGKSRDDYRVSA